MRVGATPPNQDEFWREESVDCGGERERHRYATAIERAILERVEERPREEDERDQARRPE